jgi:hypothetical protein
MKTSVRTGWVVLVALCLGLPTAWAGGRVCMEAESGDGITPPMRVVDTATLKETGGRGAGASGGKYLEVPEGALKAPATVQGEARYSFEITEPGDYSLWCRVYWLSACNSSFTMSLDDSLPFTFGKDATFDAWHWVKAPPRLKQMTLTAGRHVLTVKARQDGVKLDQILLVLDKRYVPVGMEETTGKP